MPDELATRRLRLTALGERDLAYVHRLFASPGHTVGSGPVASPDETRQWLQRRVEVYETHGYAWYGLWSSASTLVGTCGLFTSKRTGTEPEIGYETAVEVRGRGLAQEAAVRVSQAAHQSGVRCIWATIREANLASSRVIEAAGYDYVSTEPDPRGALRFYRRTGDVEAPSQHADHPGRR